MARLYQLARIQGMNGELGAPGHQRSGASQLVRRRWRDLGHVYMLVTGSSHRLRTAAASSGGTKRGVDGLVVVLLGTPEPQNPGRSARRGRVSRPAAAMTVAATGWRFTWPGQVISRPRRGMDQVDSRHQATGKAIMLAVTLRGALPW